MSAKRLKMTKPVRNSREKDSELKLETFGVGFKMPAAKPKASEEPSDFASVPLLASGVAKADWKTRVETVDKLIALAEKYTEALGKSSKLVVVLETLVKCLGDGNGKVAFKAAGALEKFIPLFRTGVEQNVHMLVAGVSANLCSTNTILKNKTEILLDLLVDTVEGRCLVQPLVHAALYGNARAKATIVAHLCGMNCLMVDVLPEVSKSRPEVLSKHLYPVIGSLLDNAKGEVKQPTTKLVQTLYNLAGQDFLESVSAAQLERVMEIVKATAI